MEKKIVIGLLLGLNILVFFYIFWFYSFLFNIFSFQNYSSVERKGLYATIKETIKKDREIQINYSLLLFPNNNWEIKSLNLNLYYYNIEGKLVLEKSITPESDKIYFLKKNQYVDICFNDKYPPLAHSFSIELGKSGLKTNPVCFSE